MLAGVHETLPKTKQKRTEKNQQSWTVVAHTVKPSTLEVEAEAERLRVQGQPLLHSEFRISLGYMKLYLKKLKPTNQDLLFPNILHLFTY